MPLNFDDAVDAILEKHPEYAPDAYGFMRSALDSAARRFGKTSADPHLSAEELYLGFCAAALEEYGPLAKSVMEHWNVRNSTDVGALVYNLIEVGVFAKQESDTQEQFDNLRSMSEILDEPYVGSAPKRRRTPKH